MSSTGENSQQGDELLSLFFSSGDTRWLKGRPPAFLKWVWSQLSSGTSKTCAAQSEFRAVTEGPEKAALWVRDQPAWGGATPGSLHLSMTLPTLQMLAGIYLSREMCSPATSILTNENGPASSGLEESWALGQ